MRYLSVSAAESSVPPIRDASQRVERISDADAITWAQRIKEYEAAGGLTAVYHQRDWLISHRPGRHQLIVAVAKDGACRGLCAASVNQTHALPGHRILWIERFQGGLDQDAERAMLAEIARMAAQTPRLLRGQIRLLHPDGERRRRWGQHLAAHGFGRVRQPRSYGETIIVDLQPEETAIMAGFHGTARRHIRAVDKNPVEIRAITDIALVARMEALLEETRARTGGTFSPEAPAHIIGNAKRYPERLQVLGLFRTDTAGPDGLLAFAVGYLHGAHAEYATAASTRKTDLKLPMSYGLAWALMRWAKAHGAMWFDFGGVTAGTHSDSQDSLGGISDFKRYFSRDVVAIADEWALEPNPLRGRLASIMRSIARFAAAC